MWGSDEPGTKYDPHGRYRRCRVVTGVYAGRIALTRERKKDMKYPGLYVIGLTGGIASGKSTVSGMLRELGAVIIDADEVSREVVAPGTRGWRQIVDTFGPGVLRPDGSINRRKLGGMVFGDKDALDKLDSIVHPLVMARVEDTLAKLSRGVTEGESGTGEGTKVVVLDAPLLFEVGADRLVDEVWVVSVDPETQMERLIRRDGYSKAEALSRMTSQMPLPEKERLSDVVIDNRGDPESTRRQVLAYWEEIQGKVRNPDQTKGEERLR